MTQKTYMKVGQSAKNKLFGIGPIRKISQAADAAHRSRNHGQPLQMLVSQKITCSNSRIAVIVLGIFTLAIGIVLSSIPWLDYIIMKNLKLINGTLSYHYWHKPGVIRLTKVFIFNVTNADGFLNNGEKPRLMEVGPFVYREDMEKVNVKFLDNGTLTFQHLKVLQFIPELSVPDSDSLKFVIPNIPLLTLTTQANSLKSFIRTTLSLFLMLTGMQPFKTVTLKELIFGYDDTLTDLAHRYFPEGKRPPKKMGLFLLRNGTLSDQASIFTGETGMDKFGLMATLNGLDHLPHWEPPCNSISASEGSLFPPPALTKSKVVNLYDKDLCRSWTLQHRHDVDKNGITAGYYSPIDYMFNASASDQEQCFCRDGVCPPAGLQDISYCQFDAPLFVSFPHFYKADPKLLEAVEGLEPIQEKHETFLKIQAKLGVPVEARARVQVNLNVEQSDIRAVSKFPSILFPIMWLEEGMEELPAHLHRWIYLATTVADRVVPIFSYGLVVIGLAMLACVFVSSYHRMVFTSEHIERRVRSLRRGSSFIVNGQHRLMILRDSYSLLNNNVQETDVDESLTGSSSA